MVVPEDVFEEIGEGGDRKLIFMVLLCFVV